MNPTLAMWIAVAATGATALFSALFMSLSDLRRGVLEEITLRRSTGRPGGARRIERTRRILEDVRGHARAMALPRLMSSALVIVAALWWVESVDPSSQLTITGGVLAALATAVVLWLFSVIIPMAIAMHAGEKIVSVCAPLIRAINIVESPLKPLARFIDEVVRRLAGGEHEDGGAQLEAELMSVIDEGKREGQIDEQEEEMIEAVVEMRDKTVEQIMTPRTEIAAMEYTDDLGAVTGVIRRIGHSRIPVYRDSLDNVAGVFYVKDLMRWLAGSGTRGGSGKPFELQSVLRPALFVPETKTVRELLKELIEKKLHIAMVADEYGGTAGLVTIEDIVEEVFGEIYDEYEPEAEDGERVEVDLERRSAAIDARANIEEVNDALEPLGVALPEGDEYDTVGGFVITTLGRIPEKGESFREGPLTVRVEEASPTRVVRVRLEVWDDQGMRDETRDEEAADARSGAK